MKNTVNQLKTQATNWDKVFAKHVADNRYVFGSVTHTHSCFFFLKGHNFNTVHQSKYEYQTSTCRDTERSPRETQITTRMRYH